MAVRRPSRHDPRSREGMPSSARARAARPTRAARRSERARRAHESFGRSCHDPRDNQHTICHSLPRRRGLEQGALPVAGARRLRQAGFWRRGRGDAEVHRGDPARA